ncbi:MAG: hypothetical protein U9Q94_01220 [Candidatus Bipolaricaulota bacterium]|nr:hypothetical protein [Candidatus Bipolaricaulota bacterium]
MHALVTTIDSIVNGMGYAGIAGAMFLESFLFPKEHERMKRQIPSSRF